MSTRTNEITVIPDLLPMRDINRTLASIGAKVDYLLVLKDNKDLCEDVRLLA